MAFLAVCTLHTVLDAETIPKNASGIIIWSTISDIGYEKIKDEPLAELYKNYKIARTCKPLNKLSGWRDLNPRSSGPKPDALAPRLHPALGLCR